MVGAGAPVHLLSRCGVADGGGSGHYRGVGEYRNAMQAFAAQPLLDVWYAHLDAQDAVNEFQSDFKRKKIKKEDKRLAKAQTHDSMKAQAKLTTMVDGRRRIISDPPTIVPIDELFSDVGADETTS
jgi:hypothetical protein